MLMHQICLDRGVWRTTLNTIDMARISVKKCMRLLKLFTVHYYSFPLKIIYLMTWPQKKFTRDQKEGQHSATIKETFHKACQTKLGQHIVKTYNSIMLPTSMSSLLWNLQEDDFFKVSDNEIVAFLQIKRGMMISSY